MRDQICLSEKSRKPRRRNVDYILIFINRREELSAEVSKNRIQADLSRGNGLALILLPHVFEFTGIVLEKILSRREELVCFGNQCCPPGKDAPIPRLSVFEFRAGLLEKMQLKSMWLSLFFF